MDIKELRIGNKLKVSDNYWTVSDILTNKNELYFKENNLVDYLVFAEPIELTEEILLKCGDINWLLRDREGYYVLINNKKIRIKFVHSLQNIYLCIEQKELVLCL